MHFAQFPGHSHDVRAIVIDDTKKGRNTQISAGAAGRRRIFALQRIREPAFQSLLTLSVAGSSSSSLWSRVTTKRRDPSSAATFHLCSRRHPFRKTAASFFARRDRPWSSGTCCLAVNSRAQRGGVSFGRVLAIGFSPGQLTGVLKVFGSRRVRGCEGQLSLPCWFCRSVVKSRCLFLLPLAFWVSCIAWWRCD